MSHTITVGGLLLSLSILVGLIALAGGFMATFAAGMDPTGQSKGWGGCAVFLLGIAMIVGGVWGLLS